MKTNYSFQQHEKLIVSGADVFYQIPIDQIEKIFSKGGLTTIQFSKKNEVSIVKNLTYFEEELENLGFVRVNRNVIVNCAHISSINFRSKELRLNNGEIISVSRRNLSKLRKALLSHPLLPKNQQK
jgi:DNA-binding LytR/AlgR family response regulator